MLPAGVAAISADAREPGYALDSLWVYRLQVGLAFFVGTYLLVIALWLAYQGRSFGRISIPGGPEMDLPDPNLEAAADGFDEFEDDVRQRLDRHDDSLDDLDDRLAAVEGSFTARLRGVFFSS